MDAMKLLTALTLRSPLNSAELTQLGIAELIVQAMKVHSSDDKHQVIYKITKFYFYESMFIKWKQILFQYLNNIRTKIIWTFF